MINEWQKEMREDIAVRVALQEARIVNEVAPSPRIHPYAYLTREMIEALLQGRSVYYYDGEYGHYLILDEVTNSNTNSATQGNTK